jgi:Protein phosphatase 2C
MFLYAAVVSAREQTLLLGESYPEYHEVELRIQRGGKSACALTVGSDPLSPSLRHKGRADIPNEDGLLLIDESTRTLLAVADGHHGHEASHHLLHELADTTLHGIPRNPIELLAAVLDCGDESPDAEYSAASTLLVAVMDRDSGMGFGCSYGDSTLAVIRSTVSEVSFDECAANIRNTEFVNPRLADSLDARRVVEFGFQASAGDVVMAFTDGVDGCHYGFPETSITPTHLRSLWESTPEDVSKFLHHSVQLALAGTDGSPGGQDNIAVAVTLA